MQSSINIYQGVNTDTGKPGKLKVVMENYRESKTFVNSHDFFLNFTRTELVQIHVFFLSL